MTSTLLFIKQFMQIESDEINKLQFYSTKTSRRLNDSAKHPHETHHIQYSNFISDLNFDWCMQMHTPAKFSIFNPNQIRSLIERAPLCELRKANSHYKLVSVYDIAVSKRSTRSKKCRKNGRKVPMIRK